MNYKTLNIKKKKQLKNILKARVRKLKVQPAWEQRQYSNHFTQLLFLMSLAEYTIITANQVIEKS